MKGNIAIMADFSVYHSPSLYGLHLADGLLISDVLPPIGHFVKLDAV